MCCLGLTSLLPLPADQLPGEALGRVFRATLDLLVAYKEQVAGSPFFSSSPLPLPLPLLSSIFIFCLVLLSDELRLHNSAPDVNFEHFLGDVKCSSSTFPLWEILFGFGSTWTEAAKEEEAEEDDGDDDDMDGLQSDDEDDDGGDVSDKEMGVDAEDGDEADSIRLKKFAAQVRNSFFSLLN